ncbi:MAG: hypothetical protein ACLP0A_13850 [Verrucomicrobiia bacterium]|jgi:hypothetical protein
MVPTLFLVLVIRKSKTASETYAKVLFGFSLTAPVCLELIGISVRGDGVVPSG